MVSELGSLIKGLQDERDDVKFRYNKLRKFLFFESLAEIDIHQQGLLQIQCSAMETYLKCLNERLVLLEAKL
jgi:hypothetical protein